MTRSVLGVDWCRGGWVGVVLESGQPPAALVATELGAMIESTPDPACIAVDMPIGLPETERAADSEARKFVGPRW